MHPLFDTYGPIKKRAGNQLVPSEGGLPALKHWIIGQRRSSPTVDYIDVEFRPVSSRSSGVLRNLFGGLLTSFIVWPYLKDLAYTLGIAQPFVGLRQLFYRKPVDWGILRDQAVERIANTRYILPKAEF